MRIVVLGSFVHACCWQVPQLPKPGETLAAKALTLEAGGKGLNVAVGCKRLGAEVDVLLGIGLDKAGDELLQLLEQEGITRRHVWRLAPQSAYGAGLIADDGQNVIAVYPGPNQLLSAEHVHALEDAIVAADLVYAQFETALPAIVEAFALAKHHGVPTVLNPSPWQNIPQSILGDCKVLIVNEREIENLLGLQAVKGHSLSECAKTLWAALDLFWPVWSGDLLIVTLGDKGCVAFRRGASPTLAPAYAVSTVNSIGAGDAFSSGLCAALAQGMTLEMALRMANACGAIVASQAGVLPALPRAELLAELMSAT